MARIRSIKPEFWASESLGTRLKGPEGRQARLLFIALWNHAEDHGVCRAAPALLRSVAFPYDEDVTAADVSRWLRMLDEGGFIVRYERNESSYLWICSFNEHQRIDRKSKTTLPEPSHEDMMRSASPRRALVEPSLQEGKGREEEGRGVDTASQDVSADAAPPAAGERPPLTLTAQDSGPKPRAPRKPSAAEALYLQIQETRQARCESAGVPFTPDRWDNARQNKALGPIAKVAPGTAVDPEGLSEDQRRFNLAFTGFLGDDRHMSKGWPLSLFMSGGVRSRYEQQALMEAAS